MNASSPYGPALLSVLGKPSRTEHRHSSHCPAVCAPITAAGAAYGTLTVE